MRKQRLDQLLELLIAKILIPVPHADDHSTARLRQEPDKGGKTKATATSPAHTRHPRSSTAHYGDADHP
jgi:hypothetical protein